MNVSVPKFDNRINWNTITSVSTFAVMLVTVVTMWNKVESRIESISFWISDHKAFHQSLDADMRLFETAQNTINTQFRSEISTVSQTSQQLKEKFVQVEKDIETQDARFDRFAQALQDLRNGISDLKTEQSVMKEILLRQENAFNGQKKDELGKDERRNGGT